MDSVIPENTKRSAGTETGGRGLVQNVSIWKVSKHVPAFSTCVGVTEAIAQSHRATQDRADAEDDSLRLLSYSLKDFSFLCGRSGMCTVQTPCFKHRTCLFRCTARTTLLASRLHVDYPEPAKNLDSGLLWLRPKRPGRRQSLEHSGKPPVCPTSSVSFYLTVY